MKVILLKIIILNGGNKLIYKNKDEYLIKTSFGNFTDVNEAVEKVPVIKDSKNIRKCVWCGCYFVNVGSGSNNRKTCSENCSIEFKRQRNRNNYHEKKIFTYNQNERILSEYIKNNGKYPSGFNQIDSNKKLGETMLWDGIPKKNGEYDWEKEARIIKKLKRSLYKNNFINH